MGWIEDEEKAATLQATRKVFSVFIVVSLYAITACTIAYNTFDVNAYPVYEFVSHIFGGSVMTLAFYVYCSISLKLPTYANIAAFGVFIYVLINMAYAMGEMTSPGFKQEYVQGVLENWSMGVCLFGCTFSILNANGKLYDSLFRRKSRK